MPLSTPVLIALMALALTAFVQAAGLLIWGASLTQRVKSLEDRTKGLEKMATDVALVAQQVSQISTQMNQLTGSWLFREPPAYEPKVGGHK